MTPEEKISKGASLLADGIGQVMKNIAETFQKVFDDVLPKIKPILEQRFTKKKFKKILQSYGIQRNEINQIMENVKAPYTRRKLMNYITPKDIKKRRMNR